MQKMVNMTISLPEEMRRRMDKHPKIKWSVVAQAAFERELKSLERRENPQYTLSFLVRHKSPNFRALIPGQTTEPYEKMEIVRNEKLHQAVLYAEIDLMNAGLRFDIDDVHELPSPGGFKITREYRVWRIDWTLEGAEVVIEERDIEIGGEMEKTQDFYLVFLVDGEKAIQHIKKAEVRLKKVLGEFEVVKKDGKRAWLLNTITSIVGGCEFDIHEPYNRYLLNCED
jgi:hypothetical protein